METEINEAKSINHSNHINHINTYNTKPNCDIFCINCGKKGHIFKLCTEPVHSYGLLCFYRKKKLVKDNGINENINNDYNKKTRKTGYYHHNTKSNINSNINAISNIRILKRNETMGHTLKNMLGIVGNVSNTDVDDADDMNDEVSNLEIEDEVIDIDGEYEEYVPADKNSSEITETVVIEDKMKEIIEQKVLMIQRRNTIGMIEFMRGKYDVSDEQHIIKLFNMMTFDEKRLLRAYDSFDMIRTLMGMKREYNYRVEYDESKRKFDQLKEHVEGDRVNYLLDKSYTKWTTPEWGLPKGRRSNKEYDIECAIREFVEESGIKYKNINVYRNIKPLIEIYRGVNGILYKHIYYLAEIKDTADALENISFVEKGGFFNNEVSNVKFYGLSQIHKILRPYYVSKLNVVKKGFQIYNLINTYFE